LQATAEELEACHCREYVQRYLNNEFSVLENRRVGFPWSEASVARSLSSVGGTLAATRAVFQSDRVAFAGHLAGGTHHAFADRGEGYCVFNDIAVAASVALREQPACERILIIDLDVHQGNGSAVIFKDEARVFTFSLHCQDNLFSKREESDLDVELPPGSGDTAYLQALRHHLPLLLQQVQPQLTFFQAGVDPHESDAIGKFKLSSAGLKRRNHFVFEMVAAHQSRLVVTMGGGYPRDLDVRSKPFFDVVQAHMDVYRGCASTHARLKPVAPR